MSSNEGYAELYTGISRNFSGVTFNYFCCNSYYITCTLMALLLEIFFLCYQIIARYWWVCTSFPHISQFRQQLIKAFTNGKVSTLATVEYFLIAFLAQRKEFIFQSKVFSIHDRNLFFGISNFWAFQVSTNLKYQQIFAWCTRTFLFLPFCNISFK